MKFGEPVPSESATRRLIARVAAGALVIGALIAAPALDSLSSLATGEDAEAWGDGSAPVALVGVDVLQTTAEAIEPLTVGY